MTAPHHSIFYRPDALRDNQPTVSKHKSTPSVIYNSRKLTDVTPGDFNLLVAIDIWQKSETESVTAWRISESINAKWRLRSMEWLANANILLIVGDGAPERRLSIDNWLCICNCTHYLPSTNVNNAQCASAQLLANNQCNSLIRRKTCL